MDLRALLARVAFGGEGRVVGGAGGLLATQLLRKGAGLPGRGWGLLLGTYGCKGVKCHRVEMWECTRRRKLSRS